MLARMPARLWAAWCAYWRVEPWGEERADLRAAMVARICHVGFGLKPKAASIDAFMVVPQAKGPPDLKAGRARVKAFFDRLVREQANARSS